MFILEFITNQSTFCNIPFYDCYSYIFLSFSERMLILSITENGEESLIFLVMTIFGECIQLNFRQIISKIHILVPMLCSRMRFYTAVLM